MHVGALWIALKLAAMHWHQADFTQHVEAASCLGWLVCASWVHAWQASPAAAGWWVATRAAPCRWPVRAPRLC